MLCVCVCETISTCIDSSGSEDEGLEVRRNNFILQGGKNRLIFSVKLKQIVRILQRGETRQIKKIFFRPGHKTRSFFFGSDVPGNTTDAK